MSDLAPRETYLGLFRIRSEYILARWTVEISDLEPSWPDLRPNIMTSTALFWHDSLCNKLFIVKMLLLTTYFFVRLFYLWPTIKLNKLDLVTQMLDICHVLSHWHQAVNSQLPCLLVCCWWGCEARIWVSVRRSLHQCTRQPCHTGKGESRFVITPSTLTIAKQQNPV